MLHYTNAASQETKMVNLECTIKRQYTVTKHNDTRESTPIYQGEIKCEVRNISNRSQDQMFYLYVSSGDEPDAKAFERYTISLSLTEFRTLHKQMSSLYKALPNE